jgi:hypothetical protein
MKLLPDSTGRPGRTPRDFQGTSKELVPSGFTSNRCADQESPPERMGRGAGCFPVHPLTWVDTISTCEAVAAAPLLDGPVEG